LNPIFPSRLFPILQRLSLPNTLFPSFSLLPHGSPSWRVYVIISVGVDVSMSCCWWYQVGLQGYYCMGLYLLVLFEPDLFWCFSRRYRFDLFLGLHFFLFYLIRGCYFYYYKSSPLPIDVITFISVCVVRVIIGFSFSLGCSLVSAFFLVAMIMAFIFSHSSSSPWFWSSSPSHGCFCLGPSTASSSGLWRVFHSYHVCGFFF
jgi:hypothetical protein